MWRQLASSLSCLVALSTPTPSSSAAAVTDAAAAGFSYTLGTPTVVTGDGHDRYRYFPDGHIASLPDGDGRWLMFWSGSSSYRTVGDNPYVESQTRADPVGKVFGGNTARAGQCGWDNGGSWLKSVFRLPDNRLAGFYHAEDWWCPAEGVADPDGTAYKSIAVTYSADNGRTWSAGQRIITSWQAKPATPAWSGAGDMSVIWDAANARWLCYFSETVDGVSYLRMAQSTSRTGGPGTWRKWTGSAFTSPGLGGNGTPIGNLGGRRGANPSVHWNGYLGQWVMVYGGWDGTIYLSSSADLVTWSLPRFVVGPATPGGHAWYPTIISNNGDTSARNHPRLYYADIAPDFSSRRAMSVPLTFTLT